MKQETKVVAIILAALIVFLSGFGLGATKGINIKVEGAAVQTGGEVAQPAPQTTTTAAPQTTTTAAPQTTTTAAPTGDTTTAAPAGDTTTAAPSANGLKVPSGNAEIAAAYNKAINDAKHYTGKVTLKKHDIINVGLADNAASSIINPVIQKLTKTEPQEETFDGGKGTADNTRELIRWIIPGGGRDAALQEAGIASASATANADGGYTMVITLVSEDSNFDGTQNTSNPTHHESIMDPLNLGSLDLGDAIKITNAALHYPGATMTATVDSQGRLVKLEQKLPLEGTGEGKATVIPVSLQLSGSMDGNYEFIYG
ncbi:MAG: hypothetical protein E7538_06065 [Ruminococcaceae bacterium]|nr:hypothetical protein [Oscillospiraceae bacterium]